MRFGISTQSFFNRLNTESSLDILNQMGVDTAEVYLASHCEYEESYVNTLVPRRGGVFVNSVQPFCRQFEPELFSANARVRTDAENSFKKVCYAAHVLGAKYYTFQGPLRLKRKEYTIDYIRIGARINQLAEIARSYGILLSYENIDYGYGNNPEFFRQLLRQCPTITTTLNVKHSLQAGYDPAKFIDAMEGRISAISVSDVSKQKEPMLPGHGSFAWDKFFSILNKRGTKATIILEVSGKCYTDIKQLKDSFDYLKSVWIRCCN